MVSVIGIAHKFERIQILKFQQRHGRAFKHEAYRFFPLDKLLCILRTAAVGTRHSTLIPSPRKLIVQNAWTNSRQYAGVHWSAPSADTMPALSVQRNGNNSL